MPKCGQKKWKQRGARHLFLHKPRSLWLGTAIDSLVSTQQNATPTSSIKSKFPTCPHKGFIKLNVQRHGIDAQEKRKLSPSRLILWKIVGMNKIQTSICMEGYMLDPKKIERQWDLNPSESWLKHAFSHAFTWHLLLVTTRSSDGFKRSNKREDVIWIWEKKQQKLGWFENVWNTFSLKQTIKPISIVGQNHILTSTDPGCKEACTRLKQRLTKAAFKSLAFRFELQYEYGASGKNKNFLIKQWHVRLMHLDFPNLSKSYVHKCIILTILECLPFKADYWGARGMVPAARYKTSAGQ